MPTPMVGVHGAIVIVTALLGLSFVADPCGGGGDLCLGGVVGVMALAVAAFCAIGLAAWRFGRRASPLLVLDCVLIAALGPSALMTASGAPASVALFGLFTVVLLALVGAALAGRAVATHRVEAVVAVVVMAVLGTQRDVGGMGLLVVGLVALGVGWMLVRAVDPSPRAQEGPPAAP